MADRTNLKLADLGVPDGDDLEIENVPHRNRLVRADKKVIVSFQITAKERYLWSIEASRRGLTMSDVVRDAFKRLLDERAAEERANT